MSVLTQRFSLHHVQRVAIAALAVLSVWMLMRILLLLTDGIEIDYQPLEYRPQAAQSALPERIDWRMFGEPVEADYGFEQPLPPTPLSLRLRGVVTGESGYAIIVDADGNEGVYRAGDEIAGGAEVIAIEARRVVLARGGIREALELPGGAAAAQRSQSRPAQEAPSQSAMTGIGIASLGSIPSQFRLDPDELAQRITILPVAGGGFRVRAGRDAAVFSLLGFHANDVVLAINGQPVNNQADVRRLFENVEPDMPLAITVRRGDRQLVLTPNLSELFGARP